ncbi:hypothetical protein GPA10_37310 [Streptomyces sp. p1417]|uniref:SpaA-like prealbumin fold domain-containing protein n=1 Tax=Streptomyces typhae TaxID=2681492 RepID=A0A6L6X9B7_9ACTN|nr:SpaA isopeptide-forming pilin-related protein [Streptomyces typhae]MVO90261.1 hypothetical protein [Streptomyces typhae]
MHTRTARFLSAAALSAAATGSLAWAPAASAQIHDPIPSASTTPAPRNATASGVVTLLKKDPGGEILAGAAFTLYDSTGKEAGSGTTDTGGRLSFRDLVPGVYRLKERESNSPMHGVVEDQDVIVTPGSDTPITIIDPFKPAAVLLKAKDGKSGKPLPGATVNIGTGDKTLLTLTTGHSGTASAKLPVNTRASTVFWTKQAKTPTGYELPRGRSGFTAKPGDHVTVPLTYAATHTTPTKPDPTRTPAKRPTEKPHATPIEKSTERPTAKGADEHADQPSAKPTGTASSGAGAAGTAASAPAGSLAHTGADATWWLVGGAGLLLATGTGALITVRRHHTEDATNDDNAQ